MIKTFSGCQSSKKQEICQSFDSGTVLFIFHLLSLLVVMYVGQCYRALQSPIVLITFALSYTCTILLYLEAKESI